MTDSVDVAVLNALVADGSGGEPYTADVAVTGDRIVFVGDFRGQAKKYVDAYGRILAPGFIDFHSHSDYSLLIDPRAQSKVRQGVTTEVGGNCGYHAAPIFGAVREERKREYSRFMPVEWETSDDYVTAWTDAKPAVNYAQQIGYNTLRSAVTAEHAKPLSATERTRLVDLVRDELKRGAVGLSYGIAYTPACFSSTDELVDVARVTAEAGCVITFHIRNEDATLLESLDEALLIGRISGARTHIGHLKTFRRPNWSKIDEAVKLLDTARAGGMDLSVDRYPHLAMNTQLRFVLPMWVHEGGVENMRRRLREPETRQRILSELNSAHGDEAREVLISLVSKPENRYAEGQFLDELAKTQNPWEVACDLLAAEGDSAFMTCFGMNRDNLDRILALDYAVVASDASVQAIERDAGGGRPHPRCFDTFPFFLAEWVFARKVLPLGTAIRKITSRPAELAGIKNRGRIAEGYFADLVLFEPGQLNPSVSYEQPIQFPTGIDLVMVNGEIVIEDGKHTQRRAGRFLRFNAVI